MSGFSPTWTNKGSDKLRSLQTIKILLNSLEKIIASLDITNKETEQIMISVIADVVHTYFTPHRDLSIEEQFDLLMESFGWKNINIETKEDNAIIQIGANRFITSSASSSPYLLIVSGIMKALGYLLFKSNVRVEQIPSQFESQQLQIIVQKIEQSIPSSSIVSTEVLPSAVTNQATTTQPPISQSQPSLSADVEEIKASIQLDLESVFSPILIEYPSTMVLPIFHKVLGEITSTFFSDIEDSSVKKAKSEFTDMHILYLIEFLLINILDSEQNLKEISAMIGQYVMKALQEKSSEDLKNYLPSDITSTVSRKVAYVQFPARGYCTYAPGEKCVEEKRDLCDFILYIWEGMLQTLVPDIKFKVGERIPATRRGDFCLVEFQKSD